MSSNQDTLTTAGGLPQDDDGVRAPACVMVIFGAAGDLTKRLIAPALYNLSRFKRLSDGFRLVGFDLANTTTEQWRQSLTEMMNAFVAQGDASEAAGLDPEAWRWLTDRMSYLQGDLNDPGAYRRLGEHLAALDKATDAAGDHLFYLAIADRF